MKYRIELTEEQMRVLEMISDCVCAGMARSGEVRDLEISPEILMAAVKNTVELCKEAVELEE